MYFCSSHWYRPIIASSLRRQSRVPCCKGCKTSRSFSCVHAQTRTRYRVTCRAAWALAVSATRFSASHAREDCSSSSVSSLHSGRSRASLCHSGGNQPTVQQPLSLWHSGCWTAGWCGPQGRRAGARVAFLQEGQLHRRRFLKAADLRAVDTKPQCVTTARRAAVHSPMGTSLQTCAIDALCCLRARCSCAICCA